MPANKKVVKKTLSRASAKANPGVPFDWAAEHEKVLLLFAPSGLIKDKNGYQPVVAALHDIFGIITTVDVIKKRHTNLLKVQAAFQAKYGTIKGPELPQAAHKGKGKGKAAVMVGESSDEDPEEDPGVTSSEETPATSRSGPSSGPRASQTPRGMKRGAGEMTGGSKEGEPVKRARTTEPLPRAAFLLTAQELERKKHGEAASALAALASSGAPPPQPPQGWVPNSNDREQ